jgi:hypothetical protein
MCIIGGLGRQSLIDNPAIRSMLASVNKRSLLRTP